jgi:hypothetical protein
LQIAFAAGLDMTILGNRLTPSLSFDINNSNFFQSLIGEQATKFFTGILLLHHW